MFAMPNMDSSTQSSKNEILGTSSAPKSEGKPVDGTAPMTGSVPADLVGTWSNTNYGATTRIVLNADGTGSNYTGLASSVGCVTLNSTTESGTAVVTADKITIYANDVVNVEKVCSSPSTKTSGNPIVVEMAWSRKDATTIVVVFAKCAAQYPNDQHSIDFYCQHDLTKQ